MHNYSDGVIEHLFFKIGEVGVWNMSIGACKKVYYKRLQKKFQFDPWHCSPYEWKGYNQAIVRYVNALHPECVVDVGFGLGEILARIKAPQRVGYDYGTGCVEAATHLYGNLGGWTSKAVRSMRLGLV